MTINCALDGPSGAGKSTIAKAVARKLGYVYVDTGALYRTIALYILNNEIDVGDPEAVTNALDKIRVELKYIGGEQRVLLNSVDVSDKIRTNQVSMAASAVSAIPDVRAYLLELQRNIAAEENIIMDGRDIGTVILPNAQVKIFMTASAEVRAQRRYKELSEKGESTDYESVLAMINERDYNDAHRETAPLKQADDAVLLDTSLMSAEEAANAVCEIISQKTSASTALDANAVSTVVERGRVSSVRIFLYSIVRFLARVGLKIIFSLKYEGSENIPNGAVIVAPNHLTWADPIIVSAGIRNPSSYMAKESVFEHKASVLLKPFHAFPVKRDHSDRGALRTAVEYLNKGYNLTIFPEGTRSKDGKLGKGKSGVAYISGAACADILPVGIIIQRRRHRRTKLTVRYGKVIPHEILTVNGVSSLELRRARDTVMGAIRELVEADNG